jgi:hypothetical protein
MLIHTTKRREIQIFVLQATFTSWVTPGVSSCYLCVKRRVVMGLEPGLCQKGFREPANPQISPT